MSVLAAGQCPSHMASSTTNCPRWIKPIHHRLSTDGVRAGLWQAGDLCVRLNCPCFICKTSLFVTTNQRGGSLEAQISHNTSVSICHEDWRWFALVFYACFVAQIVAVPMLQAQKGATTRPRSVSYAQDSFKRFSPATCGEYR